MTGTPHLAVIPGREVSGWHASPTTGDYLFRGLVIFAMLLEIVVFVEPAPVDVMLVFCLTLGLLLKKFDFGAIETLPLVGLATFALANLVSMSDSFDPNRAVWYVFVTLYLIGSWFFFVGLIGRFGQPMMTTLLNVYCFAGLISALIGIGGYLHLLPFTDVLLLNSRARGLFKDCNVYGPYFVPMALISLTRFMNPRAAWRSKALAFTYFLAALVAMFFCFSRACWLNFAVALVVFFVMQQLFLSSGAVARQRLLIGVSILLAGTLLVAFLMNTPSVKQMLAMRVTSNGLQDYDRIRFATQGLSLEAAEEHPLGIGPGQAELVFGYATHSMYMRILSENGILALIGLLVFIGATAWRAFVFMRSGEHDWLREVNLVVLACIVGHLVNSIFIDTVHWRHIWFVYALPWMPMAARPYMVRSRAARHVGMKRAPAWGASGLIGG